MLKSTSCISWVVGAVNKQIGAHEAFWCMYVFNMGKNVVRHKVILSHSRALKVWARSPPLGCLTRPKLINSIRKENIRTTVQGKDMQEGWRQSASEWSKWKYFGGSDPAWLIKGSLKVPIKMKRKSKLRGYKPLLDWWWICGCGIYIFTDCVKLSSAFLV